MYSEKSKSVAVLFELVTTVTELLPHLKDFLLHLFALYSKAITEKAVNPTAVFKVVTVFSTLFHTLYP
jgi:hypothetical protein